MPILMKTWTWNDSRFPVIKATALLFIGLSWVCAVVNAQENRFRWSAGGAMNVNNFRWSIAGNLQGTSPNILSALNFNKITSLGVFLAGTYRPIKILEIQGSYQKNGTVSGTVVDTDYKEDNRNAPTYNEQFTSNRGHLEAFSAAVLINCLVKRKYKVKAGICYVNTTQNYYLLDTDNEKLRSTYQARYAGPGLSAGGELKLGKSVSIDAGLTYYLVTYRAVANWNLVREFQHPVSFVQNSRGSTLSGQLGVLYQLNHHLGVALQGTIGRSQTQSGVDVSYLSNDTQVATRFNGAYSDYLGLRMGVVVDF